MHVNPKIICPKINWKLYFSRKVFILVGVVVLSSYLEDWLHLHSVSRLHEFGISFLCEHLFFGIPFSSE